MLILLLDGLWAGIDAKTTVYEDHTGADLYVAAARDEELLQHDQRHPRHDRRPGSRRPRRARGRRRCAACSRSCQLHDTKVPTYLSGGSPGSPAGPGT